MKPGKYKHFKGKFYEVIDVVKHSETLEEMVLYKDDQNQLWIRPIAMFEEIVEKDGKKIKRFEFIS